MKIELLEAKNFMSFKELNLSLDNQGLVLVEGENKDSGGSNGAGKSTIFEAIVWGLFGKTLRKLPKAGISHKGKGNCHVELRIYHEETNYYISRFRDHSASGNSLFFYANDVEITKSSAKETQTCIEETFGTNMTVFTSAVLFPQGAQGFAAYTDSDRKEILEKLLNMERFSKALDQTKTELKDKKHTFELISSKLETNEQALKDKENDLATLEKQEASWTLTNVAEIIDLGKDVARLQEEKPVIDDLERIYYERKKIDLEDIALADFQEHYKLCKSEHQRLSLAIASMAGRLSALNIAEEEPIDVEETQRLLSKGEAEEEVESNKRAIIVDELAYQNALINAEQVKLLALETADAICPTCESVLSKKRREDLRIEAQQRLVTYHIKEEELKDSLQVVDVYLNAVQLNNIQLSKTLFEAEVQRDRITASEQAKELQLEHDQAIKSLGWWGKILLFLRDKISDGEDLQKDIVATEVHLSGFQQVLENWERNVAWVEKQLAEKTNEESPYVELIVLKKEQIQNTKDLIEVQEQRAETTVSDIRELEFWVTGFGNKGVKSLLLDTISPQLTERINEYLSFLTDEQVMVTFDAQTTTTKGEVSDKISIEIHSETSSSSYDGLSGGERRRVDIAILFALCDIAANRTSAPIELRLLDEPFESLDALGDERVIQLLHTKVLPRSNTVLVMSHDDNLKQYFDKRIIARKQNGVSTLVNPIG